MSSTKDLKLGLVEHALHSVDIPDREAMPIYPPPDSEINIDSKNTPDPELLSVLPIVEDTPITQAINAESESSSIYNYNLYDIDYRDISISDWNNESNDQSNSTKYWESSLAFQPSNFSSNINSSNQKKIHNLYEAIFFIVEILLIFILFCVYSSKIKNSILSIFSSSISKAMAVTFFLSLIFLIIILILIIFFPPYFIDYGIWVTLIISLVMTIVAIVCKSYSSIGFIIFIYIWGLIFHYVNRFGFSFSKDMLAYIKPIFIQQWPIFVGYLLKVTILSIFFGYLVYGASAAGATGFLHFFALISFWFIIVVLGNVIYQIVSYITASNYFLSRSEDVSMVKLILLATKRAILYNIGISVHNALILPFIEPIRLVAITNPGEITWKLNSINGVLSKYGTKVFIVFHVLAIKLMRKIDNFFSYPNKCGMVYSAMFQVPISEGNRRVAEVNSKKYVHLIRRSCVIDSLYSCHALIYAIVSGFVLYGAALQVTGGQCSSVCHIAAGYGFFFTFAVFYLVRSHIGGIVDTTIYCFNELPSKLESSNRDFMRALSNIFDNALLRKKNHQNKNLNNTPTTEA